MIVAPVPICFLVSGVEPVEIVVFAMPFLDPHVIGAILMVIPGVFVMMLGVLVTTSVFSLFAMIVLGQRRAWQNRYWRQQRGAQQADAVITS